MRCAACGKQEGTLPSCPRYVCTRTLALASAVEGWRVDAFVRCAVSSGSRYGW